jgi:hypothetical protein
MSDGLFVFLGPTMDRREASTILAAEYLPPADQGSVFYVSRYLSARVIVLIDGAFGRVPAVRHKEILWAMHNGILVFGAASIGAIRAAELSSSGMIGLGLIFRWYRATPMADDDEVAVAMGPIELGAPALSDALINIRVTLRRAQAAGMLSSGVRRRLIESARATHFRDRSYKVMFDRARLDPVFQDRQALDRLERWIAENSVDQKKIDALRMLRYVAAVLSSPWRLPAISRTSFLPTESWLTDLKQSGFDPADLPENAPYSTFGLNWR